VVPHSTTNARTRSAPRCSPTSREGTFTSWRHTGTRRVKRQKTARSVESKYPTITKSTSVFITSLRIVKSATLRLTESMLFWNIKEKFMVTFTPARYLKYLLYLSQAALLFTGLKTPNNEQICRFLSLIYTLKHYFWIVYIRSRRFIANVILTNSEGKTCT